jgi:hypothetical protein
MVPSDAVTCTVEPRVEVHDVNRPLVRVCRDRRDGMIATKDVRHRGVPDCRFGVCQAALGVGVDDIPVTVIYDLYLLVTCPTE